MKVAFLGSAEFSKIVCEKLLSSHHKVVCVVTNLDQEAGRGHKIVFSKLKEFALSQNLPVLQFAKVSKEGFDDIKSYAPDVLVTASFGQLLKQNILDLAPFGVVNVHTSLLPKYRGSSPINWAIINGEKTTGVSIMKTDIGLDTGDVMMSTNVDILPDETAGELSLRLAAIGAELLIEALDKLESDEISYTKQNEQESSYYPMLSKDMAKINFDKTAIEIQNFCNGLNPWPVAYVNLPNGDNLKVYKAKPYKSIDLDEIEKVKNGQVVMSKSKTGLVVKCADGLVLLDVIKAPNGKLMSSRDYLNARQIPVGTQFD